MVQFIWDHDDRAIGIMEPDENGTPKFQAIICLNFDMEGYVSSPDHPYRGWELAVRTGGGRDFKVHINKNDFRSFSAFVDAIERSSWGEVIQHLPFEAALWTDMIIRMKYEFRNVAQKRPAENWGLQWKSLQAQAPGDGTKLMRKDVELVYPGQVLDGWGRDIPVPLHTVVPELMGNLKPQVKQYESSGMLGCLQMFLPPYTSTDPRVRAQQTVVLLGFTMITNSKLVGRFLGGCASMNIRSAASGTMKTTTTQIGSKLAGDPCSFLTTNSSDPAVDAAQCEASWVTIHDDDERPRGTHKAMVGSYNGGTKSTVTHGNKEQVGGLCKSSNLKRGEEMDPKLIDRSLLFNFQPGQTTDGAKDTTELTNMRKAHLRAMASRKLPRDYMAHFTGRNFTFETLEQEQTRFEDCHSQAVALLAEVFPHFTTRRLDTQALPLTAFLLLKEDEEEKKDDAVTAAFVEAFKDTSDIFEKCVDEIKKAEQLIDELVRKPVQTREDVDENEHEEEDVPETEEDKITMILEKFKDKPKIELTQYVKMWPGILAIAHAKLNQKFDKLFNKLKFAPQPGRVVKNFTKPGAVSEEGQDSHLATSCKVFQLKNFSKEFRNKLSNLMNDKDEETEEESDEDEEEEGLAQSQDNPMHKQSKTENTLKICACCRYKSRDEIEMKDHMKSHPRCPQCGISFENENSLSSHHKNYHAKAMCENCGEEFLVVKMKQHMKSHKLYHQYEKSMALGKIKAKKSKDAETEAKGKKKTGWQLFCSARRADIKRENPEADKGEMMKILGALWAGADKSVWNRKARLENEKEKEQPEQHEDEGARRRSRSRDIGEGEVQAEIDPEGARRRSRSQEAAVQEQIEVEIEIRPTLKPFECPVCDDKFELKSGVKKHIEEVHMKTANKDKSSERENMTIKACNICKKRVTNLKRHMETHTEHAENTDIIEVIEVEYIVNEEETEALDDTLTQNKEAEVADIEEDEAETDQVQIKEGQVVMVLRKTLHWPAKVLKVKGNDIDVEFFDKAKSKQSKILSEVKKFSGDPALMRGRSAEWVNAFKRARKALG